MTSVLFPDPFIITQTAAVRALGRRGDRCHVAWPYGWAKRLFRSRFVERFHPVTEWGRDADMFAADIAALCREHRFDVVLPVTIESTRALLSIRAELERHVAMLLPSAEQLALGLDKTNTLRLCEKLGVDHPETWLVGSRGELDALRDRLQYPAIVKHPQNFGGSRGVRFAGDSRELTESYDELAGLGGTVPKILVQEYVPGFLFDVVTVARDGVCPVIHSSARKLMYPVSGGVTCISVSTKSPELKAAAAKILAELGWNGPVELEFKQDARDGSFKLIEINPRFWASLGSSVACGVNFPAVAVDLALGRTVAPMAGHDYGVRHRFLLTRIPYAYWQLARTRGFGALRDPQRYSRSTSDVDPGDPMPDVFAVLLALRNLLAGRFPRRLSRGAQRMIHGLENAVPYD